MCTSWYIVLAALGVSVLYIRVYYEYIYIYMCIIFSYQIKGSDDEYEYILNGASNTSGRCT
jgi:hypothetical protein